MTSAATVTSIGVMLLRMLLDWARQAERAIIALERIADALEARAAKEERAVERERQEDRDAA